jgi:competence protein ComEC
MVVCVCGALILRRAYSAENSFALAWIVVVVLNPTDPFSLGCQLSFLSVFVLIWGTRRWVYSTETQEPDDPSVLPKSIADRLESPLKQWIRSIIKSIVLFYAINLMIFAVNAPLILTEQNVISPIALLIGPILVLFSSIALIAGFMLLFFAWIPGIAELLGMTTGLALHLCQGVVYAAEAIPGGVRYLPGIPRIWLTVFYLFLAIMILIPGRFTRYSSVGIMIWLILILLGVAMPRGSD